MTSTNASIVDNSLVDNQKIDNSSYGWLSLSVLPLLMIVGNSCVLITAAVDKRLCKTVTNKLIVSLAASDLLVGALVAPQTLYLMLNNLNWSFGQFTCHLYLTLSVLSITASIIHLVAIGFDRYFAIIFPTEYQRHSVSTNASVYITALWFMATLLSLPSLMETNGPPSASTGTKNALKDQYHPTFCWHQDEQYLVLSSSVSFVMPASILVYLYLRIFIKLRRHFALFGHPAGKRMLFLKKGQSAQGPGMSRRRSQAVINALGNLPEVIVEEVRSRRGSRIDTSEPSEGGASAAENGRRRLSLASGILRPIDGRHMSTPNAGADIPMNDMRLRSPTICAELLTDQTAPPSRKSSRSRCDPPPPNTPNYEVTRADCKNKLMIKAQIEHQKKLHVNPPPSSPTMLAPPSSPSVKNLLDVPRLSGTGSQLSLPTIDEEMPNGKLVRPTKRLTSLGGSSLSSHTGTLSSDGCSTESDSTNTFRRESNLSAISSCTDSSCSISRRSSNMSGLSDSALGNESHSSQHRTSRRLKLRKIASQVTHAIRRKRKEVTLLKRESKPTRLVAAIMVIFVLCWLPHFCLNIYRGICKNLTNCELNRANHITAYLVFSWLGYLHSLINPIIYTCLNKNFRQTLHRILCCKNYTARRRRQQMID